MHAPTAVANRRSRGRLILLVATGSPAIKCNHSQHNHVKDPKTSSSAADKAGQGFRISGAPVVQKKGIRGPRDLPAAHDADLLYVVARDPRSLFVYWDLNWTRLFARAGISARQVHLRVYREGGAIEATREINPFLGHCYTEVGAAGTRYHCDLGCFEDREWRGLVRSGKTTTPAESMSDDSSAQFATLPMHLTFQRMLDLLDTTEADGARLAESVGELQESARVLEETASASANGAGSPEVAALLQAARAATPTAEELAQWRQLGEELGGASWSGVSGNGFGGSSPA